MTHREIDDQLACVLRKYQHSLSEKEFAEESNSSDILMETLGITQETKSINKQASLPESVGSLWLWQVAKSVK